MSTPSKDQAATNIEHKMAFDAVGIAAQLLTPQGDYLAKLIEAERAMHNHLHISDPTLYRDAIHSAGLRQQVELARAAVAFVLVVQRIKAELGDGEGT